MTNLPLGTRVRTGEICPESGAWNVVSTSSTAKPFVKGNRMTPHDGRDVVWELFFYI